MAGFLHHVAGHLNYRDKTILEAVREFPCARCSVSDGTVVAAHSNQQRDGKGMGIKAHDYRIAALCHKCHMELDMGKSFSKEMRREIWEEAHRKTIGMLFENGRIVVK